MAESNNNDSSDIAALVDQEAIEEEEYKQPGQPKQSAVLSGARDTQQARFEDEDYEEDEDDDVHQLGEFYSQIPFDS